MTTRLGMVRVYPRTHGGTDLGDGQIDDVPGLSPHTRGNLEA